MLSGTHSTRVRRIDVLSLRGIYVYYVPRAHVDLTDSSEIACLFCRLVLPPVKRCLRGKHCKQKIVLYHLNALI